MYREMDFQGFKYLMASAGSTFIAWYTGQNWVGAAQGVAVIFSTIAAIGFALKVWAEAIKAIRELKKKADEDK